LILAIVVLVDALITNHKSAELVTFPLGALVPEVPVVFIAVVPAVLAVVPVVLDSVALEEAVVPVVLDPVALGEAVVAFAEPPVVPAVVAFTLVSEALAVVAVIVTLGGGVRVM
jgi:hypothetical protein